MKDKSEVEIVDLVLKLREKLVSFPPFFLHSFLSVLLLSILCSRSLIWRTGKWDSREALAFV